ncbi:hypothetical protein [Desulfofundulus sp.]|uniref:hypothetical protein n=1 Tax=Desulfofundulus sp. TaxID=2282750 RepID=UPI003C74D36B
MSGCLWRESTVQYSLEEAIEQVFDERYRALAVPAVRGLVRALPFSCGVRMGKKRVTMLLGNYRLAAFKSSKDGVRIELPFTGVFQRVFRLQVLPGGRYRLWKVFASYVRATGCRFLQVFFAACRLLREAAPGTRLWECNVRV